MKRFFLSTAMALMAAIGISAEGRFDMEPLKLDVPELKPELASVVDNPLQAGELSALTRKMAAGNEEKSVLELPEPKMDFDFFKSKTNPGVKPYRFIDDMTFVGIPLFVAGIAIKGDKASFRQDYKNTHANTRLISNFKTSIDDYTQFFGPVATVGLKLGGLEGRSDWPRLLASAAMSYGIMAGFVNGIKYTASEMRPDGSTANSWPSGHTATSFVGATILHKEYGLTRSPWFSVAGYGMATATGVMRILNNRHWISDVLSGAGIGILSTELGYGLGDLLFKGRGLLRGDLEDSGYNPSFFAVSMGMGFGLKSLSFDVNDYEYIEDYGEEPEPPVNIDFHTASVVDAEGAYFFNKYVGIGGRLRVRAMTAKGWSDFVNDAYDVADAMNFMIALIRTVDAGGTMPASEEQALMDMIDSHEVTVESDHLTEFYANAGLYLNLPLGRHFSLGTKFLVGRTMTQELDINSKMSGREAILNYTVVISNGEVDDDNSHITSIAQGNPYEVEWDYLTLGGNSSTTYGTGLSLTYKYKSNFSWRVFVDYDYSKRTYTLTYDPLRYLKTAMPNAESFLNAVGGGLAPVYYKKEKDVSLFTVGGSFIVNF